VRLSKGRTGLGELCAVPFSDAFWTVARVSGSDHAVNQTKVDRRVQTTPVAAPEASDTPGWWRGPKIGCRLSAEPSSTSRMLRRVDIGPLMPSSSQTSTTTYSASTYTRNVSAT
jgi:hypothetical protein